MRAFLAADSCPSLRRRLTSCSSWNSKGSYKPGLLTSNAVREAQEDQSGA